MITARPGETIEPQADNFPTGQAGVIGVQVRDTPAPGEVIIARTVAGIVDAALRLAMRPEPAGSSKTGSGGVRCLAQASGTTDLVVGNVITLAMPDAGANLWLGGS
jgi:hypothetical protein